MCIALLAHDKDVCVVGELSVLLDNVTLYSAKLRNPTQVATMTTALALDLGVFLEK